MPRKVLVAYATKNGFTAGIAAKIGETLEKSGLTADVVNLKKAKPDPAAYDAVVAGSAIYIGAWRGEAANFIKKHAKKLSSIPVWLFTSGPIGDKPPDAEGEELFFPKALKPYFDAIKPREIALFHGGLDPENCGFFDKFLIKNAKLPTGDFRKWDQIAEWAGKIAAAVK